MVRAWLKGMGFPELMLNVFIQAVRKIKGHQGLWV